MSEESDEDLVLNTRAGKMPRGVLTLRDQLLISQALYVAIEELGKEEPYPQTSNINDMKELLEDKFPLWLAVAQTSELLPKLLGQQELDFGDNEEESYNE